ncbi:hypothetical protein CDEST_11369 [Colletotrichum destructivum]|uniref:Uncharacterized protein n=1 Tax=Colletotrichum destructivum TaxID=34406 RepID=A0AAX4IT52_9PEZI|nr:hypothetical protein CDEST_11369 [Colletotrichum destructivum]
MLQWTSRYLPGRHPSSVNSVFTRSVVCLVGNVVNGPRVVLTGLLQQDHPHSSLVWVDFARDTTTRSRDGGRAQAAELCNFGGPGR